LCNFLLFFCGLSARPLRIAPESFLICRAAREPSHNLINDPCTLYAARRTVIEYRPMKRTLIAVATAVLVSMMVVMFLGGLLKKAARFVDGLGGPLTPPPRPPDDNTVHVRNGSG
jgi:hypothetical protein